MAVSTNIITYLFSKTKNTRGRSFVTKTRTIFITMHNFAFSYISRIQVSVTFRNKYGFGNIPDCRNNQQFKPKHSSLLLNITIFGDKIIHLEFFLNRYLFMIHWKLI